MGCWAVPWVDVLLIGLSWSQPDPSVFLVSSPNASVYVYVVHKEKFKWVKTKMIMIKCNLLSPIGCSYLTASTVSLLSLYSVGLGWTMRHSKPHRSHSHLWWWGCWWVWAGEQMAQGYFFAMQLIIIAFIAWDDEVSTPQWGGVGGRSASPWNHKPSHTHLHSYGNTPPRSLLMEM